MNGATPEVSDYSFTLSGHRFAVGFSRFDRCVALCHQPEGGSWSWLSVDTIPDNSAKLTAKQCVDYLKTALAKLTAALKKFLSDIGGSPVTEIPKVIGEDMIAWLIKNRTRVDAQGNITLDDTGIV